MQFYIIKSCNVCMKMFKENDPYSSKGESLYFFMKAQGHNQQESRRKKYWTSASLLYLIHNIQQILHQAISIFFVHYKKLWKLKNFMNKTR